MGSDVFLAGESQGGSRLLVCSNRLGVGGPGSRIKRYCNPPGTLSRRCNVRDPLIPLGRAAPAIASRRWPPPKDGSHRSAWDWSSPASPCGGRPRPWGMTSWPTTRTCQAAKLHRMQRRGQSPRHQRASLPLRGRRDCSPDSRHAALRVWLPSLLGLADGPRSHDRQAERDPLGSSLPGPEPPTDRQCFAISWLNEPLRQLLQPHLAGLLPEDPAPATVRATPSPARTRPSGVGGSRTPPARGTRSRRRRAPGQRGLGCRDAPIGRR